MQAGLIAPNVTMISCNDKLPMRINPGGHILKRCKPALQAIALLVIIVLGAGPVLSSEKDPNSEDTPYSTHNQPRAYPAIALSGSKAEDFVPRGWSILSQARGDLNANGLSDLAMIIEASDKMLENRNCGGKAGNLELIYPVDENSDISEPVFQGVQMSEAAPRILIILLARKDGSFRLGLQDNRMILRANEGGMFDPVDGDTLSINRKSLFISYNGGTAWRWSLTSQLQLRKGRWQLIGYSKTSFHTVSKYQTFLDYNLLTGKLHMKSRDESGKRPACLPCLKGKACPSDTVCGTNAFRPEKKDLWISGLRQPPIYIHKLYCRIRDENIIPRVQD